ncbi:bifunctional DNA-formamidopyrimidine glycosylase/DNA-(apurinic or apyrimidinic site) lyase [Brachybacterium sp. EF45031]|uniref:bifunctional DNA-formamidopyrimidine glycosylase/DNA-(apurinic or apyrimidinic site) lyase n=1 Tax=Brachybacterium sillae TaxID=2810536 RepID=UPI00217E41EE|nr:bifunctional DNA-formamidopyrimidine glycosylase/DNA-(apurinic or apyrimidinic site) lyase [Brachybacterium sillae]MCS6710840.1 bifunctional DNA-formamidopyrimidine glycosylase/DNA-(apurinic or apyrimidinic site) lyase [Brachybacterium sillae]
MPELPEVEVVRRGLLPHVLGREITAVRIGDERSVRRQSGGPRELLDRLPGTRVTALARRGKFLWWRLADARTGRPCADALMVHLGMSGQLRVRGGADGTAQEPVAQEPVAQETVAQEGPASDPVRHLRVRLTLEGGVTVDFLDQRLFGGLWLSPLVAAPDGLPAGWGSTDEQLPVDASHIARDLLDEHADLPGIARVLRGRSAGVKSLLLSQQIVSGIGNIYADEALWAARAHPAQPGRDLSQIRALRILRTGREVMQRALEVGGTSFDALYVNVDGRSGYFARSLDAYGREGEPCRRCGTPLVRTVVAQRSSHLCPRCQRLRSSGGAARVAASGR